DLLGSPFLVDFSELTATLADPGDLPVARRLRREAARTTLLRPREAAHPDLLLAAERPQWDGLVFDYTLLAPSSDPLAGSGYTGALEPGGGWSVEAYRGGALIAFDSADAAGRFSVRVPVRYGENPVDFVAYGPLGEIREFNQTFRVAEELLPAGRLEYGLSAGSCSGTPCGATANVDLHYGVSDRWTLRSGVDRFWRDTLPDLTHAYASLVGSPSTTWTVTLDGVTAGFARAGLRYEPS